MRIYVGRVRVIRDPYEPENPLKASRHISLPDPEGFTKWQDALDSITEWEAEAFACWSVTVDIDGNLMLMLFDKLSSHPHYVPST